MEEKRMTVYGKDAENKDKRMFDYVTINGQLFVETKDSHGHRIRTLAAKAFAAYQQMRQSSQIAG